MDYKLLAVIWIVGWSLADSVGNYVHWKFGKKTWREHENGRSVWTTGQFITGICSLALQLGVFFYLFNH